MSKEYHKILITALLTSLLSGATVYISLYHQIRKTAVVDAVRLVNEYQMKTELEKAEQTRLNVYAQKLDSLEGQFKIHKGDAAIAGAIANQFQQMKAMLDNEYAASNQNINIQVWKRLNPVVDEFGKKHNLHLIIGANGMGSVLYNDSFYDLTNDLIKFANDEYKH